VTLYRRGVRDQAARNLDVVRQTYGYGRIPLLDVIAEQRRYIDTKRAIPTFCSTPTHHASARKGSGHIPALKEKIMQTIILNLPDRVDALAQMDCHRRALRSFRVCWILVLSQRSTTTKPFRRIPCRDEWNGISGKRGSFGRVESLSGNYKLIWQPTI